MIEIKNLSKTYGHKDEAVYALKNININIESGDIYGIIGMSGAGKSTLIRCINMLERHTSGSVLIDGIDLTSAKEKELRKIRRKVTMIFQNFNLLMQKTCLKNICFPLELEGVPKKEARKRAEELLELVGLPDKAKAYPAQLSGGQKQRIAIARALATNPEVLLLDEATSALDPSTTIQILDLIKEINEKLEITTVVITHEMSVVEKLCNHVAILDKGEIVEQGEVTTIFQNPKSEAAKQLVFPGRTEHRYTDFPGEILLQLSFNSNTATKSPIIAGLAVDEGICANIISAQTKVLEGKTYGKMVLSIPDNKATVQKAIDYIKQTTGITAECLKLEGSKNDFQRKKVLINTEGKNSNKEVI